MKYPLNEQVFINKWLSVLENPDDGDREFASALAMALNSSYYEGLETGKAGTQYDK